jgi:hypothetical protein
MAVQEMQKNEQQFTYDPYPEIKIPPEFVVKFEQKKGFEHGEQLKYAKRELKDELIIRYLQAQYQRLELYHETEMREMEIRIRHKVHGYARACLETLINELRAEYKQILTQFDLFKEMESKNKQTILKQ